MKPLISVIIPTHAPHRERLTLTLAALAAQSLTFEKWELLLVDNASPTPVAEALVRQAHPGAQVIREPQLGLTHARLAGIARAQGDILVFVDDDNLLDRDYLTEAVRLLEEHSEVTAAGGRIEGRFEIAPPVWAKDHLWSLAVRDYGQGVLISDFAPSGPRRAWPVFTPVGAGIVVRAAAARRYAAHCLESAQALSDRRGRSLGSAGDCELVMHAAFLAGGQVAYSPALRLTHLIPLGRLTFSYHVRLAYQGGVTWGTFLAVYGFMPRIRRASLLLRVPRVFWRSAGWTRRGFIHFCAATGEFVGRSAA